AMSGRPHGPYTVKKRRPVLGMPYRWLYACAICALAFLVAAYSVSGCSADLCSVIGMSVFGPYTELVDAYTRCCTPWCRQPSRMCRKPVTLLLTYTCGFSAA